MIQTLKERLINLMRGNTVPAQSVSVRPLEEHQHVHPIPAEDKKPAAALTDLSGDFSFFKSKSAAFVLDRTTDRMFRMSGDNMFEITSSSMKLKIALESPQISERDAIRLSSMSPASIGG